VSEKLREIWYVLTADKKKAGVLGVSLAVLAVLGLKTLLPLNPSASQASPDGKNLSDSPVSMGQDALERTVASLDRARSGGYVRVPESPALQRDLFAVDPRDFPPPVQAASVTRPTPETKQPEVEQPELNADDEWALREKRVAKEADALRLGSVMVGRSPLAVIETTKGRRNVLRVGGVVEGFTLLEVTADSVLLEKDGVKVRLWLAVQEF